jgi:phosphomannomutase/phosphoglucomutase
MGRLFGTNGVRGTINNEITVEMILSISRSAGTILGPGPVVISRDSRAGGEMFQNTAVSGLLSTGCDVIDIGPAPTPTLQFMVPRLSAVAGIMITASHNPAEFNGIKVMGSNGIEVSRETESKIEDVYFGESFPVREWNEVGKYYQRDDALSEYTEAIKSHVDIETIRKRQLTIVVDGANSVGSLVTPRLMRDLGCKVISINAQMDGAFPGRPPEPLPENLVTLSKMVMSVGADLGIAHDGDADRATFVDEEGQFLWGDQSFAIVASRVLRRKSKSTLVTPVSSGRLIEDIAKDAGAKIDWTVVGSVDVSHRLEEIGAEFGGEENGGLFYPPHQSVRDGAMTVAQVVEIMSLEGKKLSELVDELPTYFNTKKKIAVPPEKKMAILDSLLNLTDDLERITLDGVKLVYENGWILMRPSGTEPLWRCFSEGTTQDEANRLNKVGMDFLEQAIQNV